MPASTTDADSVTGEPAITAHIPLPDDLTAYDIAAGVGAFHMAVGPKEVWVRFPANGVVDSPDDQWLWTRIDVSTDEPSSPFAFEAATVRHNGLRLVTTDALWAVGYDDQDEVRVARFDPTTLQAVTQSDAIGSTLSGAVVDADTRTVWITTGKTIVHLDIA